MKQLEPPVDLADANNQQHIEYMFNVAACADFDYPQVCGNS